MWPFAKQSARRKEIRRSKAERGLKWYQQLPARLHLSPIATALLSAVLVALLVNAGGDVLGIQVGQTVPRAITSRVEFKLENMQLTIERRGRARANAENYYELDVSLVKDIRGRLINALQVAKEHAADPDGFEEAARRSKLLLDEDGRNELLRIVALTDSAAARMAVDRFQRAVNSAIERLIQQSPLLAEAIDPANRRTAIDAILIDPRPEDERTSPPEQSVPVSRLLSSNQPEAADMVASAAAHPFPLALRASMKASLVEMLRGETEGTIRPIYRYEAEKSNKAAQQAYAAVPDQYDIYGRGDQLAGAGAITEDEYRLLRKEHQAYRQWVTLVGQAPSEVEESQFQQASPQIQQRLLVERENARQAHTAQMLTGLGYSFLALLVPFGLAFYLSQRRESIRADSLRQLIAILMLLAVLAVARMVYVGTSAAHYAIGAQAFATAVLTIVYARGPVLAVLGGLAMLITLATRQGMGFFLVLLTVSMILSFGLRDIRNRGKIVLVGALAGLIVLVTTVAVGLMNAQTPSFAFWDQALLAAGTTLAAAFIVEGILPGIERLFKISTSMSLLEWCDASRKLLRLLAAEAPGTYNHSLMVGTLAEAAAEAIGAQGLLARTGSYYHDIGKTNKPGYFAENQAFGVSRHDRLSPAMSHLIIIGHVKDGIEMAREYGLPANLHSFIPEHHGTTVVEYFYHAASQQRKPGDPEVTDVQFRYPGPKPQSRESAIVMLCDAVEGAVRAMSEPTPNRIEDTVTKITQKRLIDGQFDECDLTFRELETIEKSLVKSLSAIYHSRVAYPTSEDEKKGAEMRAS